MIIDGIQTNERLNRLIIKRALFGIVLSGFLILPLLLGIGCSQKDKALAEIQALYEAGEYRETIAYCKHSLRRGFHESEVYYYYGLALIHLGRDHEAFRQLDKAVEIEPVLAGAVASTLLVKSERAHRKGNVGRAQRRLMAAVKYNPVVDMGLYAFIAGDAFFGKKDYEKAASFYEKAVREFPENESTERALYRLAVSYETIGLDKRSRESLRELLATFPRSEYAREAQWKLANLLYEEGEREFVNGNFGVVIETIEELLALTTNATLAQKSRFLRGEAYEGLGEFKQAYEEYRAIIQQDQGASGRIVERAREKLAILREVGMF